MTAGLFRIVIHFDGIKLLALVGVVLLVAYLWAKAHLTTGRNQR